MKALLSSLALAIVVGCVAAIAVVSGLHHAVPVVIPTVALGALTGQFALLAVPSFGPVLVASACIVAISVLASLGIPVPETITGLLVAAVTGHFALQLPTTTASVAQVPATATTAPLSTDVDSAAAAAAVPAQPVPVIASVTGGTP